MVGVLPNKPPLHVHPILDPFKHDLESGNDCKCDPFTELTLDAVIVKHNFVGYSPT